MVGASLKIQMLVRLQSLVAFERSEMRSSVHMKKMYGNNGLPQRPHDGLAHSFCSLFIIMEYLADLT